jgi:hypothetical protein
VPFLVRATDRGALPLVCAESDRVSLFRVSSAFHGGEWSVSDVFRDEWRIRLVPAPERAGADVDWRSRGQLDRLVMDGFTHSGASDNEVARVLLEIYDELTTGDLSRRLPVPTVDPQRLLCGMDLVILETLLSAMTSGLLRIEPVARTPWPFLDPPGPPPPSTSLGPVPDETTYFVLRIVDEVGASVDGISVVFAADGSDRTTKTDGAGMARIDGVMGSTASVRLGSIAAVRDTLKPRWAEPRAPNVPKGDGVVVRRLRDDRMDSVALLSAALTTLVITPCTWIEIYLIGEDGGPIPGEAYRIELPDGSVREGRLDADGLSRVDDVDPGICLVTFPNLDREAWAQS